MIALIILLVLIVIVCLILLDLYMGKKYFSTQALLNDLLTKTSGDAVFYHDGEPLF
ncbi:hypothetical protein ACEQPO_27690 [Bacillus sp. SL00103]